MSYLKDTPQERANRISVMKTRRKQAKEYEEFAKTVPLKYENVLNADKKDFEAE